MLIRVGKCAHAQLGTNYIPISKRNRGRHITPEESRRYSSAGSSREGMVGEAKGIYSIEFYEGIGFSRRGRFS